MTYEAQQALIDKIRGDIYEFKTVTNSSFSPDERVIEDQTPAVCIVPSETSYESGIGYLIAHDHYEIHVIVQHEKNDNDHQRTEIIAGELLHKIFTSIVNYSPEFSSDVFTPVKRLRPQYFETEGFAVFTVVVKIKTFSDI